MEKKDLRKLIAQRIKELGNEEKIDFSKNVCKRILDSDFYRDCDFVFSYMATKNELDTSFLNHTAAAEKKLFLPKTESGGSAMDFYGMSSFYEKQLAPGRYGIMEPDDSCKKLSMENGSLHGKKVLMVVPGLGFSENKNRLGHGMGFYDIYIERLKKVLSENGGQIFLLGVCFPCQIESNVDLVSEDHDIKMDEVLF